MCKVILTRDVAFMKEPFSWRKEVEENEFTKENVRNDEVSTKDDYKDIINDEEITTENVSIPAMSDGKSSDDEEEADDEESVASNKSLSEANSKLIMAMWSLETL